MAKKDRTRPVPPPDLVMERVTRHNDRDRCFLEATDEVVKGLDLEGTSDRAYGKTVFVANLGPAGIPLASLAIGVSLRAGTVEPHAVGELRCLRQGAQLTVGIYGRDGSPLTRILSAAEPDGDGADEGLFTWFGPVEDYGTPWSDSSPAYCQVITVERLRRFARGAASAA